MEANMTHPSLLFSNLELRVTTGMNVVPGLIGDRSFPTTIVEERLDLFLERKFPILGRDLFRQRVFFIAAHRWWLSLSSMDSNASATVALH
jgi:hypothetical protein